MPQVKQWDGDQERSVADSGLDNCGSLLKASQPM